MSEQVTHEVGVQFEAADGRRSSQRSGRSAFADAVRAADESLARRIELTADWRKGYIEGVRDMVAAGTRSSKDALRIASDGLDAVRRTLCFTTADGDIPLRDAVSSAPADEASTVEVGGTGRRVDRLEVPYKGEVLAGDALLRQLERWESAGVMEASCRNAIADVVDNPSWLDLTDDWFVLLGAASEMGPLPMLSAWGANVIALDLPRTYLWDRIITTVVDGAGRAFVPVRTTSTDSRDFPAGAGLDLLAELPSVAAWLKTFDRALVVGNYVYADGATFVRVAGAADALVDELVRSRPDVSLAYLATPTDVFAVPESIVSDVRDARSTAPVRKALGAVSFGKLYSRTYENTVTSEDGHRWGLADALVPIQGANYALAKAVQRWRAVLAREEGTVSSAIVAPATRTRSVTKNRFLAAAYRGASSFGVEIFEPQTCRALTAALLVRDLRDETSAAQPATHLEHPYELFCDAALHGGMWRMQYEPRSVLPLGVVLGAFKRA